MRMRDRKMSDDKLAAIGELLEKAEANLKKIQIVGEVFVFPVLNQWRYATRHMFHILNGSASERELTNTISHLRRAYADSCDILLTLKVEKAHSFIERYKGVWSGLIKPEVFKAYVEAMYSGSAMQRDENMVLLDDPTIASRLVQIEAEIERLEVCEKELQMYEPALEYALGRERWRLVFNVGMAILTVGALVLSVFSFVWG